MISDNTSSYLAAAEDLQRLFDQNHLEQVDAVLPLKTSCLKTRRPAAITELITHA